MFLTQFTVLLLVHTKPTYSAMQVDASPKVHGLPSPGRLWDELVGLLFCRWFGPWDLVARDSMSAIAIPCKPTYGHHAFTGESWPMAVAIKGKLTVNQRVCWN